MVYCFPDSWFYKKKSDSSALKRVFPGSLSGRIHASGLSVFFQQGTVIKADVLKRVGGFNIRNRTSWDYDLFLNILSQPRINAKRSSAPIACFFIQPLSITSSISNSAHSSNLKQKNLNDKYSSVLKFYGSFFLIAHKAISRLPRPLFLILKYSMDPVFSFWTIRSILSKYKNRIL